MTVNNGNSYQSERHDGTVDVTFSLSERERERDEKRLSTTDTKFPASYGTVKKAQKFCDKKYERKKCIKKNAQNERKKNKKEEYKIGLERGRHIFVTFKPYCCGLGGLFGSNALGLYSVYVCFPRRRERGLTGLEVEREGERERRCKTRRTRLRGGEIESPKRTRRIRLRQLQEKHRRRSSHALRTPVCAEGLRVGAREKGSKELKMTSIGKY